MKLSREKFIKGSENSKTLNFLLELAEKAYKTWQPIWSPFIAAPILEEISKILDPLDEINYKAYGGFFSAERKRILFQRNIDSIKNDPPNIPVIGLQIKGNFLFDKTSPEDYLLDLYKHGITYESIGDIWLIGDQGAQLICTPETAKFLNSKQGSIRTVTIDYSIIEVDQLKLPNQRIPKIIVTVEASLRLDAIASAGFGLSRSKIVNQIKDNKLRLNWKKVTSNSQLLSKEDKLQLEGKGMLKIISIEPTKKERWKIELLRE